MILCRKCGIELKYGDNWLCRRSRGRICNLCENKIKNEYNKRTGMNKNSYKKMKHRVSERLKIIFIKRGSKCEICGCSDVGAIQVHHPNGKNHGGEPQFLLNESEDILQFLCANCHFKLHKKGYLI